MCTPLSSFARLVLGLVSPHYCSEKGPLFPTTQIPAARTNIEIPAELWMHRPANAVVQKLAANRPVFQSLGVDEAPGGWALSSRETVWKVVVGPGGLQGSGCIYVERNLCCRASRDFHIFSMMFI